MRKTLSADVTPQDLIRRITKNDYLGHPNGVLSFAYGRVSTDEQAAEGYGLERQLEHIHEVALKEGFYIPVDMFFLDDHTGFEFEDRPALTELRKEFKHPRRRSSIIVMEYLDRLSRDADWHQGYLLSEMKKYNVTPVFWKQFGSRIERAVMGAISQEGMELTKERMRKGMDSKARNGLLPNSTPAYGYQFVDSNGNPGDKARKDKHYGILEDQAGVVQWIFEQMAYEGRSQRWIAMELQARGIKPPKRAIAWTHSLIQIIIRNTVYKGYLVWNETKEVTIIEQDPNRPFAPARKVKRRIQNPQEDWIIIPTPPIVETDLWEAANRAMSNNKKFASRNGKTPYLLTGLCTCVYCGRTFTGAKSSSYKVKGSEEKRSIRCYACPTKFTVPALRDANPCEARQVKADYIENVVWSITSDLILHPQPLIEALDAMLTDGANAELLNQARWLEEQINDCANKGVRLQRAYMAGAFDELEFAEEKQELKKQKQTFERELAALQQQMLSVDEIEARKRTLYELSGKASTMNLAKMSFDDKKKLIHMAIDNIELDTRNNIMKIHGVISGDFQYANKRNADGVVSDGDITEIVTNQARPGS
jgi:site-specific DNA recombinase